MMVEDRSQRDSLVRRILDVRERLEDAAWLKNAGDEAAATAAGLYATLHTQLSELHQEYADNLPRLAMSRCPFTGKVFEHSIDPWGLDGPWWDSQWPIRPWDETPESLVVLSGAMRLGEHLETTPFLVLPGPQTPCVASSLLERPGVVAVVSSLAVGGHTAYPIAYFSDPPSVEPPTLNTWGSRQWNAPWSDLAHDLEIVEDEDELDGDLEWWIAAGRLLWIAPGDLDLRLRSTIKDCPYLEIDGSRVPSRLFDGELVGEAT